MNAMTLPNATKLPNWYWYESKLFQFGKLAGAASGPKAKVT
jgi:hypothetical protein